jgi:hypothetical protein
MKRAHRSRARHRQAAAANLKRYPAKGLTWAVVLAAGFAGGIAEILWVAAYASVTAGDSALVAQQITASLWPMAKAWPYATLLGILIHLMLSVVLAALAAPLLLRLATRRAGAGYIVAGATFLLAMVWTVNLFIVLPLVNPAFISLMPYSVSLASKLLFGVSMGVVLSARITPRLSAHNAREAAAWDSTVVL